MQRLDVHQHLLSEDLIEELARRRRPPMLIRRGEGWTFRVGGEPDSVLGFDATNVALRSVELRREKIDRALVALSTALGIETLPGEEALPLPEAHHRGVGDLPEARAIAATCDGVRVFSAYVPNGREPGSEHYEYKLRWLAALRDVVAAGPEATVVCGDVNIAPADEDVFDPEAYAGHTHVTAPERAALAGLQALGLRDVVRDRWPGERVFTYWDYRAGMFHRDLGMRIDLVLAAAPVADRVQAAWVDRKARKGKGPSDHAPVDFDEAPDGDVGPVVPPPSRPPTKRGAAKLPQSR
jgi:exonuclease III